MALAARPAGERSSTGWPQWAPSVIAFDMLFAEPDRLSPRNVVRDVPGVEPSLLEKLPDNDEIFAQSIVGRPVVLGFGLSNQGNYRPPVKAGFAFTGESPIDAPPHFTAATPAQATARGRTHQASAIST